MQSVGGTPVADTTNYSAPVRVHWKGVVSNKTLGPKEACHLY